MMLKTTIGLWALIGIITAILVANVVLSVVAWIAVHVLI